jgi:peptidoglycan/LPS O-acetylase OafA/YrhL
LKKTKWISFIIVFFTVLFFFTDIFITRFYWLNSLIMMVLFALFINTISHNNYDLKIKNRFLNYFGKISYGIYMFHAIVMNIVVFAFMKIKLLRDLPESLIIFLIYSLIFVLTIIISHISYKYFESYFLNLKRNYKV